MAYFVLAGFVLTRSSRGPSAIAELLVLCGTSQKSETFCYGRRKVYLTANAEVFQEKR